MNVGDSFLASATAQMYHRFSSRPEGYHVRVDTEVSSPRKERGPLLIFKIGPIAHITPH
ncbi:hypothetical protein NEUTE1DRAFT_118765 [Neurospora tetrasperma FGSC 2508]|uniref:Uncharacterized protein n=1 Tax=Neurospora tetrasperma (strain FGSC 2508 / ATCC MYA-4615 / P0657) TaxID=510951 RepID=F8N242_NEUT8|nr:uncharacterized protein NEUTE1DRAFT_118765 [Neurospora tetrasperma FGSC 2508]EGO52416.1 hypothetical protein NEUTE1DRAFT_118765 [Neurospora tetrasperma FGSC 2508]